MNKELKKVLFLSALFSVLFFYAAVQNTILSLKPEEQITHTFSYTDIPSTCMEGGYTLAYCTDSGCNYAEKRDLKPISGHSYLQPYYKSGSIVTSCQYCGASNYETATTLSNVAHISSQASEIDIISHSCLTAGVVCQTASGQARAVPYLGYTFVGWEDGELSAQRTPYQGQTPVFAKVSGDLPVINVSLSVPLSAVHNDKSTYVSGTLEISSVGYSLQPQPMQLRGRGNSSWAYTKKGYKIKFDQNQSLFGENATVGSRHWALVANPQDKSLLRNATAYDAARTVFDGIEYSTSCQSVELFINDEYRGVYNLLESVRVEGDRVNIPSEYGVLDTGYLIEYDHYASGVEGVDYFRVDGLPVPFTVHSPSPSDFAAAGLTESAFRQHVEYIRAVIEQTFKAISEGDYEGFSRLCDQSSWVDMYLLQEYMKNEDSGFSSFFIYKKPTASGGKLFLGPAWDFDFAGGGFVGTASPTGLYVGKEGKQGGKANADNPMLVGLMRIEQFASKAKARLLTVYEQLLRSLDRAMPYSMKLSTAVARNNCLWQAGMNYTNEFNNQKGWLSSRALWLKNDWAAV